MHSHSITAIFIGALAVLAAAKDHTNEKAAGNSTQHEGNTTVAACHQVTKLTHLANIASNTTKAAEFVSKADNQTKAQDKLDNAQTKLATMSSNATLMAACGVINAHEELKASCKAMKKLQKLSDASTNATAKSELMTKAKNQTKEEAKIAAAPEKLKTLTANATLVSACDAIAKAKGNSTDGSDSTSANKGSTNSDSGVGAITVPVFALLATTALGALTML